MCSEKHLEIRGSFKLDDHWVWCGSPVQEGDKIHLYASVWSKQYPMFAGYLWRSRIVRAEADAESKKFVLCEDVFPEQGGKLQMAHNPAVRYFNGRWYMYFIAAPERDVFAVDDPKITDELYHTISIYMAVADSPAGPWVRRTEPILKAVPGLWDSSIVTNPAPCIMPDGRVHLYYRSNTPQGLRIGLAVAENPEAEYIRYQNGPVMTDFNVEDPFVWHDGNIFRMVAKDMTGDITGEYHAGAGFVSNDGINWQYCRKSYSKTVVSEDGTLVTFGSLERPQVLFAENGVPEYLFAAVADGPGGFNKAKNTWNISLEIKNKSL